MYVSVIHLNELFFRADNYFQHRTSKPGAIITEKKIGEHSGLWNFTIGHNARKPGMPEIPEKIEKHSYL